MSQYTITERLYRAERLLIWLIKRADVSPEASKLAINAIAEISAALNHLGVKEDQIEEMAKRLKDGGGIAC